MVDISKTFTEGQAYVGVSRVRRKEDMQVVLPWGDKLERAFRANPWVVRFYRGVGERAGVIFGEEEEEGRESHRVEDVQSVLSAGQ